MRTTCDSGLKPCPFCGDAVSITYNSFDRAFVVWHKNDICPFVEPMYISGDNATSLKEAYEIWNTRDGSISVEYRCSNCGKILSYKSFFCPDCGAPIGDKNEHNFRDK